MYHNIKYIILAFFSVFSFACTFKGKVTNNELSQANFSLLQSLEVHGSPFNSVFIPKSTFRLDHNGQFRTLKSSIYAVKDSILIVTINTPLGTEIAQGVFARDSVRFFDLQEKKGYSFDYKYLSVAMGLDMNFIAVQNLLFGIHSPNYFTFSYNPETSLLTESSNFVEGDLKIVFPKNQESTPESVYFKYSKPKGKLTNYRIYTGKNQIMFSLVYIWKTDGVPLFPRRIEFDLNYFNHVIGIDFDYKSIVMNQKQPVTVDHSAIKIIPLALEHEVF